MGFERNLSTAEIVAQALYVQRRSRHLAERIAPVAKRRPGCASPKSLRNIVLMGMGEPLQNYEPVMRAVDIFRDPAGLAIGGKQITLSTVGVAPAIVRMADEGRRCSLAVSLHAASQDERAAIVPAARAWPLDQLMEACRYYCHKLGRRIFFEWSLIAGRNDSAEQARALAHLIRCMPAQVNLIPLNPTPGFQGNSGSWAAVERFQTLLREQGLLVSVRRRRGIEIVAGCGQLAAEQA
jgi:23S rRNA (adenine2503-C2)-methyltransferase